MKKLLTSIGLCLLLTACEMHSSEVYFVTDTFKSTTKFYVISGDRRWETNKATFEAIKLNTPYHFRTEGADLVEAIEYTPKK